MLIINVIYFQNKKFKYFLLVANNTKYLLLQTPPTPSSCNMIVANIKSPWKNTYYDLRIPPPLLFPKKLPYLEVNI